MSSEDIPQYLATADGHSIAYLQAHARADKAHLPGIIYLGGFRSDMTGSKATFLHQYCVKQGLGYVRFDYVGTGQSSGAFEEGSIGVWQQNAMAVLDQVTDGPQILVGSSMGSWLMFLTAQQRPERLHSLIGMASAPDFTEHQLVSWLTPEEKAALGRDGRTLVHDGMGQPYLLTQGFLAEARQHLLLTDGARITVTCPVHLMHGLQDDKILYQSTEALAHRIEGTEPEVRFIAEGNHRLSSRGDLDLLVQTIESALQYRGR